MVALIAGGAMGLVCLAGLSILLYRRVTNARITAATRKRDWLLLSWILGALLLGLLTITESAKHSDGEVMVQLMMWAQHLLTFQGDAASFMLDAPWLFKRAQGASHQLPRVTGISTSPGMSMCLANSSLAKELR